MSLTAHWAVQSLDVDVRGAIDFRGLQVCLFSIHCCSAEILTFKQQNQAAAGSRKNTLI